MFKAYENDTASDAIYDLTIENQLDCVNIYGNLQLTKDQHGLQAAKKLQALLNDVVRTLEQTPDLPEKIHIQQAQEVENPFL